VRMMVVPAKARLDELKAFPVCQNALTAVSTSTVHTSTVLLITQAQTPATIKDVFLSTWLLTAVSNSTVHTSTVSLLTQVQTWASIQEVFLST